MVGYPKRRGVVRMSGAATAIQAGAREGGHGVRVWVPLSPSPSAHWFAAEEGGRGPLSRAPPTGVLMVRGSSASSASRTNESSRSDSSCGVNPHTARGRVGDPDPRTCHRGGRPLDSERTDLDGCCARRARRRLDNRCLPRVPDARRASARPGAQVGPSRGYGCRYGLTSDDLDRRTRRRRNRTFQAVGCTAPLALKARWTTRPLPALGKRSPASFAGGHGANLLSVWAIRRGGRVSLGGVARAGRRDGPSPWSRPGAPPTPERPSWTISSARLVPVMRSTWSGRVEYQEKLRCRGRNPLNPSTGGEATAPSRPGFDWPL